MKLVRIIFAYCVSKILIRPKTMFLFQINVSTNVFLDNMVQIVKVKFTNGLSVINYENQVNDTNS